MSCVVAPGSKFQIILSKSVNSQDNNSRVMIIKNGNLPVNEGLKSADPRRRLQAVCLVIKIVLSAQHIAVKSMVLFTRYNAKHLTYSFMKTTLRQGEKLNA